MRITRFLHARTEHWGIMEGDSVRVLARPPFAEIAPGKKIIPLKKITLLPPARPGKVILAGLNYKDHARELGMPIPQEPVIFLKPPTAVIGHKQEIMYPPGVKRLDFEAELALVIKKKGRNIPEHKVNDYILGYTCLNDVTARDIQQKDVQWTRAKSFDTFCPAGPWLETELAPDNLRISAFLNGEKKQDSRTANFIFPVPYLVSFISRVMTLEPGDIISTGTPPGVGPMQPGDTIRIEIEGIGTLENRVQTAENIRG